MASSLPGDSSEPAEIDKSRLRVLIADDSPSFRDALVDLLGTDPSIEVTGVVGSADEVAEVARRTAPQVALVDVNMPGGGESAARSLKAIDPQIRILALTAHEERTAVIGMLRAGAIGYLLKGVSPAHLPTLIKHAAKGEAILSRTLVAEVIEELIGALDLSEGLSEQLKDLEKTKAEMVQVLSHELQTPVAILQGSALSIARADVDLTSEDKQALRDSINRASRRISKLVKEIAVAATVHGHTDLPTRPVRTGDLLELVLAEFPEDRERIVVVESDVAPLESKLWAAPELAVRAIARVIENALVFSEPGGIVTIETRIRETEIELHVLDRGAGVSASERTDIFQAFTQSDTSLIRSHGGIGMGLYLARTIMDAHSGRIWVEARSGGGSRFVLSFLRLQE